MSESDDTPGRDGFDRGEGDNQAGREAGEATGFGSTVTETGDPIGYGTDIPEAGANAIPGLEVGLPDTSAPDAEVRDGYPTAME